MLLQFFQIQFTGLCLATCFHKFLKNVEFLSWIDLFFRILEIYCAANDSYYFIVKEVTPYLLKPIFLAHYVCQSCVTIIPFLKPRWMQFFCRFLHRCTNMDFVPIHTSQWSSNIARKITCISQNFHIENLDFYTCIFKLA